MEPSPRTSPDDRPVRVELEPDRTHAFAGPGAEDSSSSPSPGSAASSPSTGSPAPAASTGSPASAASTRRPRGSPRLLRWLASLIVVLLIGLAAGATLQVQRRDELSTLHAERFDIDGAFEVVDSGVWPAVVDRPVRGVQGAGVEISDGPAEAGTALTADQWVYGITLMEASPASVASGNYTVGLAVDGEDVGTVHLVQAAPNGTAVEGARVTFGIGPELARSTLFYVVVELHETTGPVVEYTLASSPSGDLTWTGDGGEIDGVVNPTLTVPLGSTLRLTVRNADDILHNVGIEDDAGDLQEPPGWSENFAAAGDTATIAWTPAQAGTYTYLCQYHAGTMNGTLVVEA